MEIKQMYGNIIYRSKTAKSFGDIVEEAVRKGVSLRNADLRFSRTLRGRDLRNGDLEGANFNYSDLTNTRLPRNLVANLDFVYKDKKCFER